MEYLGPIISEQGVATDQAKIAAVLEWHVPTTATQLRSFLGLTRNYRRFVKDYGIIWSKKGRFCVGTLKGHGCLIRLKRIYNF
jgi:hypothetical protein